MRIIGLDLSLTSAGVADESRAWSLQYPRLDGPERLDVLSREIEKVVGGPEIPVVVMEGYSFGSSGRGVRGTAELGGVVRLLLWRASIPYVEVPPAKLKKFATGTGVANKDTVLIQAVKRSPIDIPGNDAADAWWLRQMGAHHYGEPDAVSLPATHLEALKAVDWPVKP